MLDTNIGFNSLLNNLKNDLAETIKKSGLPIGIIYYIVKDLLNEITETYKDTLLLEANQQINNDNKNEEN